MSLEDENLINLYEGEEEEEEEEKCFKDFDK